MHVTRCPRYARHAPVTRPTYPAYNPYVKLFATILLTKRGFGLLAHGTLDAIIPFYDSPKEERPLALLTGFLIRTLMAQDGA